MAFVLKDGQGTLFKNDKKGNDAAPDYRGELMIGEQQYKIAGWLKEGKAGVKWMSLKAEIPEQRQQERTPARSKVDIDSDVPW